MALVNLANSNIITRERCLASFLSHLAEIIILDACRSLLHPKNHLDNNDRIVTKFYMLACCCLSHSAMLANGNTCNFGVTA